MLKNKLLFRKRLILASEVTVLLLFVAGMFIAVLNIQVVREFFGRASGQSANIIIDASSNLGPMPRPWRNLAQGGEAFDWSMKPIVNKVKALNPDYIRIDHIYDFYHIVQKNGDQLTFDFSKLDPVLDDIKASGATPFISLSYMPDTIATSDIVSEPKNWSDWQLTVQKTIEHVSGEKAFANVYYEVWNEPDLFGGWKRSGDRNYLTLYTYSARGAANAKNVRSFKLGGPATTALYKNWFYDFLNTAKKNNLRVDFYSWHRYNRNIDQFEKDISETQEWLKDFPEYENLEMVISEWGHNSDNDPGYDGSFGAAHTAATAIQMVGVIDKGFVFEIEDGKDPAGKTSWGRWGLMTNQAFGAQPKPRYQALRMIDQIGDTRLDLLGKGTWVKALAAKQNEKIQVVMANYDPEVSNVENVPITFTNIIPGSFTLQQTFLGGRSNTVNLATTSAILQTTVNMPTNSVAFLELIPASGSAISTSSASPILTPSIIPSLSLTPEATASISPTETPPPIATASATPSGTSGFGRLLEP